VNTEPFRQHQARRANGEIIIVSEFREVADRTDHRSKFREHKTLVRFKTEDESPVWSIDAETFQIAKTKEILKKISASR